MARKPKQPAVEIASAVWQSGEPSPSMVQTMNPAPLIVSEARAVPRTRHGPQSVKTQPRGMDRLRAVLRLSASVDSFRVCEDAASEIERLREKCQRQFGES